MLKSLFIKCLHAHRYFSVSFQQEEGAVSGFIQILSTVKTTAKFRQRAFVPGTQPDTTIMLPSYSGHYFLSNTFCLIFHDVYPKSCTSCVLRNLSIGLMSI